MLKNITKEKNGKVHNYFGEKRKEKNLEKLGELRKKVEGLGKGYGWALKKLDKLTEKLGDFGKLTKIEFDGKYGEEKRIILH